MDQSGRNGGNREECVTVGCLFARREEDWGAQRAIVPRTPAEVGWALRCAGAGKEPTRFLGKDVMNKIGGAAHDGTAYAGAQSGKNRAALGSR